MNRRHLNFLLGLSLAGGGMMAGAEIVPNLQVRCKNLEARLGGRLGVSCMDVGSGSVAGYGSDERFPMCSTFKWLAVAAVLSLVDAGRDRLDRRLKFGKDELMDWSPVTKNHAGGGGMTLGELCEAAITESDNTAANLVLGAIGAIPGFNRYLRSIGDASTRLDRGEPMLNEAIAGDVRDTTTPNAMVADLYRLLLGNGLSTASREQLTRWMLATKYSGQRLRSGLPEGWRLADKTGSGNAGAGTAGDVGVLWPRSGAPIVLAVYLTRATVSRQEQELAIATVGRWVHESASAGDRVSPGGGSRH